MTVRPLSDLDSDDLDLAGGKGASLGELVEAGFPVPPGFVVTTEVFRSFVDSAGIAEAIAAAADVDVDDPGQLAEAEQTIQRLIRTADVPEPLVTDIRDAYARFADGPVAVRSSAIAEDQPDASFAGQQESFLNVTRPDLIDRIRDCWASAFTQRAIYYRAQHGYDHRAAQVAVVVQRMVDAEKSGVMFTRHPSTGADRVIIEAAWGLGEVVVSGSVSPDSYVVDGTDGAVIDSTTAEQEHMLVRDDDSGETVEVAVPADRRADPVLDPDQLHRLTALGRSIESHYGSPQDIEWAIGSDGVEPGADQLYVLQSRPITTIRSGTPPDEASVQARGDGGVQAVQGKPDETLCSGVGASPGIGSGPARIVDSADDLDLVEDSDVIVTPMTTPDMVPGMKRASAIVTDRGGMTSHAAIVSRELGVPAVVGTETATATLQNGQAVTVDGETGAVRSGGATGRDRSDPVEASRPSTPVKPMTATEVKVNVSIPEAAQRAAATGADGVGLLRLEHLVLSTGMTPERFVERHGDEAFITELVEGLRPVVDEFYPRTVRVRTLDAPTDEFRQLEGGDDEPHEHNPMLGYRGIRRSLDSATFDLQLRAIRRLTDDGYDNVEVMFPLVNDASEVSQARDRLESAGIDPERRTWGVMIETPASALAIDELCETEIDFASFGTNDLTQYTLAVDRNNERVADRYDELHPAVLELISRTIQSCREHGVRTGICGQAGSKPEMVRFLVNEGISSISANIDAVRDVQHEVKRVEQRLLLDSAR